MKKIICIAGKNNIAVQIAKIIREKYSNYQLVAIFNKNDNGHNGFQKSFKLYCQINGIKEVQLEEIYNEPELIFLSLEFDKIIDPNRFSTKELFNIHFSLLPEYKGMFTSALPILHCKNYSGVTLHKIDRGIDTGDIINQIKIDINDDTKSEQLYELYIKNGIKLVTENLSILIEKKYKSIPQTKQNSSYFSIKTIDYSNLIINLNQTAYQIQRQINAYVFPSYQLPKVKGYEIYQSQILEDKSNEQSGKLLIDNEFYIDISTIDYNIRLYKDLRVELFEIARKGDINKLIFFISKRYDIKKRSKEGWDIAIIAAYNDQFEFLDYLLDNLNWDINTKNNNGTSLVMYLMTRAAQSKNIGYLKKFLLRKNIRLSDVDYFNKNIWEYSEKLGNTEIINLLISYK